MLCVNAVSVNACVDPSVLMRDAYRGNLKPMHVLSCVLCLNLSVFICKFVFMCECSNSRMSAHLKVLRADFLAILHPGNSGFGLPGGLAHKRRNSA